MQPHKFSYPEQNRIYQRLFTLVGPGAATFYKDACCLMEMDPPLESTTHLVGHLLREIESSLRAVLIPIVDQTPNKKGSNDGHKKEILAILKTLDISEASVAAQIWLKLPGKESKDGLHKRAHREDLAPPRIVDENFRNFWRDMYTLLDKVLDKFETRAALIREKLDELLKKSAPINADIDFLRLKAPNSVFAVGYFFDRLESSAWLKPLYEAGFFNNPPGLEIDLEGKTFRIPVWAQSRYLIKVAPHEPEAVLKIGLQLFDVNSNNIWIYEDLAEAALQMPPEFASRWVERAIGWLTPQPLSVTLRDKLGKLITYLTHENQVAVALNLAQELLAIFPQTNGSSPGRPITRLDEYYYDNLIKEHVAELVEKCPDEVLTLFCDLLDRYLSFLHPGSQGQYFEDHIPSWIFTIDNSSANLDRIDSILARSVWDVSKHIAERDVNQSRNLFQKFQGYHWRVFDYISLHLLRSFPAQLPDLIIECLTDRDRLDWLDLRPDCMANYYACEYALLLREQFANLPVDAQEKIFCWLLEEPKDVMKIKAEQQELYVKYWRRDWFSIISDYLPPNLRKLYEQLVQELGTANSLDSVFENVENTVWRGPNSPKSGAELAKMAEGDMNELFTFLQQWQPSGRLCDVSRNDLAWELAEQVIAPNPQKFVIQIEQFKALDPQFMVWFLRGLKNSLNNSLNDQSAFSWEPVFTFCEWMLENLRDIREHPASDGFSEWNDVCDAIIEIIDAGLLAKGVSRIPLTLRKQIWRLLAPLTIDSRITPGFTLHDQGSSMGPYGGSINAARGKAMRAVVRYAFWLRQDDNGNAKASQNFDDMPEVQQVLEWHLNPQQDPSSAIRAVYGRWFPLLLYLASDWTLQRIDQIFPEEPASQWLFEAAWEGYLFGQQYTDVFSTLRRKYVYAIAQLPSLHVSSSEQSEVIRVLSNHLLALFWYGLIDLGESDKLLEDFFDKAPIHRREEFMQHFSWRLLYGDFKVDDELRQRLQNFIQWRIEQAKCNTANVQQFSDLKYFSWLFASGKLDDQWSMSKLVDVLKLLGTVNQCEKFLERLESLAPVMPQEAVECLSLMANGSKALEWFDSYRSAHHRAILRAALDSENNRAQQAAKVLVNRLVARNSVDYRDLLS
jgi:hypothetical protein